MNLESQTWLSRYAPGVPATIDIPDEPVGAALAAAAERWPDRVAVDFFGATITYAQLATEVARAAGALAALGVGRGDRVALIVPNSISHIVAFQAVLRLGGIVIEHNPTYTAEELAHQLADSGATVALVWQNAVPAVLAARDRTALREVVAVDISRDLPWYARLALRLPVRAARHKRASMCLPTPGLADWHDLVSRATPIGADVPGPSATDIALLQYTGGTTGTPKAAILTHRNLVANAIQAIAWIGCQPGRETIIGALPFFHVFGLMLGLILPTRIGGTLIAFPKFDVDAVLAAQRRRPATFIGGVAPMFERLANAAVRTGADITSIRLSFAGAMPISAETSALWETVTGGLLVEGYGMTETSAVALGNPCTADRLPGTLGVPFPSTDIRVVDTETDSEVPREAPVREDGTRRGEILIRGPQVFSGYWNRPEETSQQLLDGGWVRTGDIVSVGADGVITLVDRIKEMIIAGGFKVYPSQVEDHLRMMPGVLDVAVVGVPGEGSDERVAAAVVLDESVTSVDGGAAVTLASLRAWGEQRLARYALPRELFVLPELPRSQIGKVLRRVVREGVLKGRGQPS